MKRRLVDAAAELNRRSETLTSVVIGDAALCEQELADAVGVFG